MTWKGRQGPRVPGSQGHEATTCVHWRRPTSSRRSFGGDGPPEEPWEKAGLTHPLLQDVSIYMYIYVNMVSLCMGHHWLQDVTRCCLLVSFLLGSWSLKNNLLLAILKHFQIFQAAMVALIQDIQGQNTLAKYFKANCLCSKRFA